MVEYPGIEPGVPEGGGFTVHCITIDASTPETLLSISPTYKSTGAQERNRTFVSAIPKLHSTIKLHERGPAVRNRTPSWTLSRLIGYKPTGSP